MKVLKNKENVIVALTSLSVLLTLISVSLPSIVPSAMNFGTNWKTLSSHCIGWNSQY